MLSPRLDTPSGRMRVLGALLVLMALFLTWGGGSGRKPDIATSTKQISSEAYEATHNLPSLWRRLSRQLDTRPEDPVRVLRSALDRISRPKVVIVGAPASGKGTQCEYLKKTFGFVHLSTGDLLRSEVKSQSTLGLQAQEYMNSGKLVPDELVVDLLLNRMEREDVRERGWLLDGFPRTVSQLRVMQEKKIIPDSIVYLDVADEIVIERVEGRRLDPETGATYHLKYNPPPKDILPRLTQRADDTREKIAERLRHFHREIIPLLDSFAQPIHKVSCGNEPPADIFKRIARDVQTTRWRMLDGLADGPVPEGEAFGLPG